MKEYLSHIDYTLAAMTGNCLLLGPIENIDGTFPDEVTSITEWHEYPNTDRSFDTFLSIENLASCQKLEEMLINLLQISHADSVLLFCDQTAIPNRKNRSGRQDITGALWNTGWSVIECFRNTIGEGKRSSAYVFGKARPKRSPNPQN
tara:strand:+ start:214 stop:657 length:444 start_codon:yes stop_codon:yes gene_type:complete